MSHLLYAHSKNIGSSSAWLSCRDFILEFSQKGLNMLLRWLLTPLLILETQLRTFPTNPIRVFDLSSCSCMVA